MEFGLLLFVLIVILLIVLSTRERLRLMYRRDKEWDVIGEAKSSPMSRALTGLVGTAGGIYLSLVLMQTFLELELPPNVQMGSIALEPLAAASIAIALLQPFAMRFVSLARRRR
ncbi:MAG: hypothetical protein VR67_15355 [Peptococcaceae bacterium BRH_c8a]|nr:MAG: hypothetical protein VR67_15355 [Peptococcaceae bacterium BRH_c8a]